MRLPNQSTHLYSSDKGSTSREVTREVTQVTGKYNAQSPCDFTLFVVQCIIIVKYNAFWLKKKDGEFTNMFFLSADSVTRLLLALWPQLNW